MSLHSFLNPKSVAVVGASGKKDKIGRQILDNVIASGFKGKLYPINLKEKRIANLDAYANLGDLPRGSFASMLVVIAIPAKFVVSEIEKCAKLGVKNVIIISAGFGEQGGKGLKMEEEIEKIALRKKMNVLGPNCLGLINNFNNLNATFTNSDRRAGNIALLSQSGAIGSVVLDWLKGQNINLGYFFSLGNKVVLGENEILEYLLRDKEIEIIVLYLEEVARGKEFVDIVSRLSKKKIVAVLPAGNSSLGSKLASSHTGAIASSERVMRTALTRAGAVYLEDLGDLFNVISLSKKIYWHNNNSFSLNVLTNAGGLGVLTADEVSGQGVELQSSVDVLGDAPAQRYQKNLREMLSRRDVDNVLVLLSPQTSTEPIKTAQAIINLSKKHPKKLLITSFVGGNSLDKANRLLKENNIPVFGSPEEAVRAFAKVVEHRKRLKTLKPYNSDGIKVGRVVKDDDYLKSLRLLKKYKIDIVKTIKYAKPSAVSFKYPVVVKVVGPKFLHKTDKQAVITDINNRSELIKVVGQLEKSHRKEFKDLNNYIVVQPQIDEAQELILGFKRDSSFGAILMVGLGGIYAEVFKEVNMSLSDLDLKQAKELLKSLKIYPILKGARGKEGYDINNLAKAIVNLARLANEHPEIKELDINPVFVQRKKVLAGDVRIIL